MVLKINPATPTKYQFSDDERMPSIDCCRKASLPLVTRLYHALWGNLIPAPALGADYVVYASSALGTFGDTPKSIQWLFSHTSALNCVRKVADRVLATMSGSQATQRLRFPGNVFSQIVHVILPYLQRHAEILSSDSWACCAWKEKKLVVMKSDRISFFTIDEFFASGTNAKLYRLSSKITADRQVLKLSKSSESRILYEYDVLSLVNQGGPFTGIQLCPSTVVKVEKKEGKRVCTYAGYITPAYQYSGLQAHFRHWNESSAMIKQLLSGLKHLHRQEIVHGDIKPENVLVHLSGRYDLSDFEGAYSLSTLREILSKAKAESLPSSTIMEFFFKVHTEAYLIGSDQRNCEIAVKDYLNGLFDLDSTMACLSSLLMARDIYALAKSFYEMLAEDFESPVILGKNQWTRLRSRLTSMEVSQKDISMLQVALEKCLSVLNPPFDMKQLRFEGLEELNTLFKI